MLTYDNILAIESAIAGDIDGNNVPLPLLKEILNELASRILVADSGQPALESFCLAADEALRRQDNEITALEEENTQLLVDVLDAKLKIADLQDDNRILGLKLNDALVARDEANDRVEGTAQDADRYAMLKALLPSLLEIAAACGEQNTDAAEILKNIQIDKLDSTLDFHLKDPATRAELGLTN